jgi:rRNA maturation endonuclease Nob1
MSELVNGAKASALIAAATMGEEASKQAVARMKRRCPACNQIFETTEIGDYVCDDCGSGSHIAH